MNNKTTTIDNQIQFYVDSPFNAETDFSNLNQYFATNSLEVRLQWSLETFSDQVAQVTSFGPTGMVILAHLARLAPGSRVITIDTELLFEETYALWETVQERFPIHLDIRQTPLTLKGQAELYSPNLWQTNPDLCCHLRKVIPQQVLLAGLDGWITGLRRDQSPTRAKLPFIEWDKRSGLVKLNPLADWSRGQVWKYILEYNLPYNPLHDQGYASIGCTPCTRPTTNESDERSGRWQGSQKTECGIHL